MAAGPSIHAAVLEALTAAFGAPTIHGPTGHHWSLPAATGTDPVSVVLTTSPWPVRVWVIDPHNCINGISWEAISSLAEVAPALALIRERVLAPRLKRS